MRRSVLRATLGGVALALTLLVLPMRALAGIVYGVTGAGGGSSVLSTIDPATGNVLVTVGTVTVGGTGVMVSGIAFNPVDHGLYGSAVDPVSGKGELLSINLTNAVATVVGAFGLTPPNTNATSIAFSPTGTLFGYYKGGTPTESLYTINAGTGAATVVGGSGIPSTSGNGMAFNGSGTLYFAGAGATGPLYTLNTTTGAATSGPTLTNAPLTLSQIKGMAFDDSGTLFGVDLQTASKLAHLVKIDPVTGVITDIGATQNGLSGIAFQGAAVPEPGSLALVGVVALAWGIRDRVRRQARRRANG